MPYSSFTLDRVAEAFQLKEIDGASIFADSEPVVPSAYLTKALSKKAPLAKAIGTEKAKSELIVADILILASSVNHDTGG